MGKMTASSLLKDIAEGMKKMAKKKEAPDTPEKQIFLSTGNTLLNLALSNKADGGLLAGRYYLHVGDSSSGKTFFAMNLFAEALRSKHFSNHRFIYDDVEGGNLFDLERLFGASIIGKIEAPAQDDCGPVYSDTLESFYYNVDDAILDGRPFVYVLDSVDSLTSEAELDKFSERKEAAKAGKTATGTYAVDKAKTNSANLRKVIQALKNTTSILVVINQTRVNLGFGYKEKIRSGGIALEFYATASWWTSIKGTIRKSVNKIDRNIGNEIQFLVDKNRITGYRGKVIIPFFLNYGFDDISSCVSFLVNEGRWVKNGSKIDAGEFGIQSQEKLVAYIEKNNKEEQLHSLVESVWKEVSEAMNTGRKPRYGSS